MKAVLVVDMPECCGDCQLMDDDCMGGYCNAHGDDYIDIPDTMGGKPKWCPLQVMPEPKSEEFGQTIISSARAEGWNACLNTITGSLENSEIN